MYFLILFIILDALLHVRQGEIEELELEIAALKKKVIDTNKATVSDKFIKNGKILFM